MKKLEAVLSNRTERGGASRLLVGVGCALFASVTLLPAQSAVSGVPPTTNIAAVTPTNPPVKPAAAPHINYSGEYVVTPDDVLQIDVLGLAELSHDYSVGPSGNIEFPLLKEPVPAAGLSLRELADSIGKRLHDAGMVSDPHISIQVKQSRVHSVAIVGSVRQPQNYPLNGTTTLMDALSAAGGLSDDAGNTATISRGPIGMQALAQAGLSASADPSHEVTVARTVTVDLSDLIQKGDPAANLQLFPGDRVTVQRAGIIYVVGAVNKSGGFVLTNNHDTISVLKAVALAENIKSTSIPQKAMIIRKDAAVPGGTEQIPVDLKKILQGHAPDRSLVAEDILFVPESGRKKAMYRAGEAMAQASSLMVYRIP